MAICLNTQGVFPCFFQPAAGVSCASSPPPCAPESPAGTRSSHPTSEPPWPPKLQLPAAASSPGMDSPWPDLGIPDLPDAHACAHPATSVEIRLCMLAMAIENFASVLQIASSR